MDLAKSVFRTLFFWHSSELDKVGRFVPIVNPDWHLWYGADKNHARGKGNSDQISIMLLEEFFAFL